MKLFRVLFYPYLKRKGEIFFWKNGFDGCTVSQKRMKEEKHHKTKIKTNKKQTNKTKQKQAATLSALHQPLRWTMQCRPIQLGLQRIKNCWSKLEQNPKQKLNKNNTMAYQRKYPENQISQKSRLLSSANLQYD